MNSITSLEDWKVDGFYLKKSDTKEGVINNVTMSGVSYNIMSFIDYHYDLKVNYLTEAEMKNIRNELISTAKLNKNIEFYAEDLKKWGFTSFSENSKVSLIFGLDKINFKPSEILGLYDFTLECYERVKV